MRSYKRKTNRGSISEDVLKRAAEDVRQGGKIRNIAKDYNINRMTLTRYIKKIQTNPDALFGYNAISNAQTIFPSEMEHDLASHIKILADMFHGLSTAKCRVLAYELAIQNQIKIPPSWLENKKAGMDWWLGFKKRNHLAIRSPEPTSFARACAFNRPTVNQFFDNLATVMDQYNFQPEDIFNLDETGTTTVQTPKQVVAEQGRKQVGSLTSGERGELVTLLYAISASGNVLPPMFIFPRVNYKAHFIRGAPSGSIGCSSRSGWINEDLFYSFLEHMIQQTRCSNAHKILIIMDNHESHISLKSVDLAKENGIILLTIPPHTSHRLQPLDRAVYGPFKAAYNRAMDGWLRSNPGRVVTIYDIPALVKEAHMASMLPRNITSGFQNTGIYPYNRDIFSDADYAPAATTDRDMVPEQPNELTTTTTTTTTTTPAPSTSSHKPPESSSGTDQHLLGQQSRLLVSEHQSLDSETPQSTSSLNNLVAEQLIVSLATQTDEPEPPAAASKTPDRSTSRISLQNTQKPTYVSPSDLVPIPKAAARRTSSKGRKKGRTCILTNTPMRNELASQEEKNENRFQVL